MATAPSRSRERPRLEKGEWAGYGAKMTEFAERLADEGLKLCYHHHMGTIVQSERDIDAFMAHTRAPVRLLLDTGHARWGGADPAALARRLSRAHRPCALQGRARGARCAQSNAGDWSFLDSILGKGKELGVYTVPGDGMIDYVAVFKELKGYSGWVGARGRAGPEKGAGAALTPRRASRTSAPRSRKRDWRSPPLPWGEGSG